MEQNKERIKHLGTDVYAKQASKKETRTERSTEGIHQDNGTKQRLLEKAKEVRRKLQMTSLISKSQMKHKLGTDKTNQVRRWCWWPVERQQLNDMVLQVIAGIWVSKLSHSSNVLNNI